VAVRARRLLFVRAERPLAARARMQAGADANAQDAAGRTALSYAAASASLPVGVLDTLIASGADVDLADAEGRAPLHWAATIGERAAVDALIRAGASLSPLTRKGEASPTPMTPAELAAVQLSPEPPHTSPPPTTVPRPLTQNPNPTPPPVCHCTYLFPPRPSHPAGPVQVRERPDLVAALREAGADMEWLKGPLWSAPAPALQLRSIVRLDLVCAPALQPAGLVGWIWSVLMPAGPAHRELVPRPVRDALAGTAGA